jgi:hypothetical protein
MTDLFGEKQLLFAFRMTEISLCRPFGANSGREESFHRITGGGYSGNHYPTN